MSDYRRLSKWKGRCILCGKNFKSLDIHYRNLAKLFDVDPDFFVRLLLFGDSDGVVLPFSRTTTCFLEVLYRRALDARGSEVYLRVKSLSRSLRRQGCSVTSSALVAMIRMLVEDILQIDYRIVRRYTNIYIFDKRLLQENIERLLRENGLRLNSATRATLYARI